MVSEPDETEAAVRARGPVLPADVECWIYVGDELRGRRDHNLVWYGTGTNAQGVTRVGQFKCYRCGLIVNRDQLQAVSR